MSVMRIVSETFTDTSDGTEVRRGTAVVADGDDADLEVVPGPGPVVVVDGDDASLDVVQGPGPVVVVDGDDESLDVVTPAPTPPAPPGLGLRPSVTSAGLTDSRTRTGEEDR
jgi:hypothetical protein